MNYSYSHEENYAMTFDRLVEVYMDEIDESEQAFTYEQLEKVATMFVAWEEKNMPKDCNGKPNWEWIRLLDIRVFTGKEWCYASDWAECLELFADYGKLPKIKQRFPCYITEMHEGMTDRTDLFSRKKDVYNEIKATFGVDCYSWDDVERFVDAHMAKDERNDYSATIINSMEEFGQYFQY